MRSNLEPTHCLFESIVFMLPNYMWLKPYVVVELGVGDANLELDDWDEGIRQKITGIPTYVMLLSSQRDLVLQQR